MVSLSSSTNLQVKALKALYEAILSYGKKKSLTFIPTILWWEKKKGRGIRFGAVHLSMKPNTGLQHSLYHNNKGFGCLRLLMYYKCQLCARKSGAYRTVFSENYPNCKAVEQWVCCILTLHLVWWG